MKKQEGFTLIELLLSIGIAASILLVVTVFISTVLQARVKHQTISEVEQQGIQVMQIITQSIRNAEAINQPAITTSSTVLSLDVIDTQDDPTIYEISADAIQVTEGSSAAIPLTNQRVIVSDLLIENLSAADTPGSARIRFTLTHINPASRNEYDYAKTFIATASLR